MTDFSREDNIRCPKCRRFGMSSEGSSCTRIFLRCMWHDCGYVVPFDEYKEPKSDPNSFKKFRKTIKVKHSVMD